MSWKRICFLLILLVIVFSGCGGSGGGSSTPANKVGIALNDLPFLNSGGNFSDVIVVAFNVDPDTQQVNVLSQVDFGSVNCNSSVFQNMAVPAATQYLGFYLFINGTNASPAYFFQLPYQTTQNQYQVNWWLSYAYYFNSTSPAIQFGISMSMLLPLSFGSTATQDFSTAYYYVYDLAGINGKSFSLNYNNTQGTTICNYSYDFDTLTSVAYYKQLAGFYIQPGQPLNFVFSPGSYPYNDIYISIVPADYSQSPPISNLTATDYTNVTFNTNFVELGADGNLYFSNTGTQQLDRWNLTTGKIDIVPSSFASPITSMIFVSPYLYLTEGPRLWQYNTLTGALANIYTTTNRKILSIYYLGNYIMTCEQDSTGGCDNCLFQFPSFTPVKQIQWVEASLSAVYLPNQNIIYLGQYGQIDSQQVNITTGQYQFTFGTVNPKYPTSDPLRLFDTGDRLITGAGTIFDISNSGLSYETTINYTFVDLVFNNGQMYLMTNTGDALPGSTTTLTILSETSPYSLISTPFTYANRTGIRLFKNSNNLIVVSQDTSTKRIMVDQFSFASLNSLTLSRKMKLSPALQNIKKLPYKFYPYAGSNKQIKHIK